MFYHMQFLWISNMGGSASGFLQMSGMHSPGGLAGAGGSASKVVAAPS